MHVRHIFCLWEVSPIEQLRETAREALRYLGVSNADSRMMARALRTAAALSEECPPRFVFRAFPLSRTPEGFRLEGSSVTLNGSLAERMLSGCGAAALLACTLGLGFERKLRALERRDMGEAALFDACGSAWVEQGCAEAERAVAGRFAAQYLTDRFSPGYGDLPLSLQPDILSSLNAEKRLGIHVSSSFLMTPAKSVTAVVGIADHPQPARIRGCGSCSIQSTCPYRKEGTHCAV